MSVTFQLEGQVFYALNGGPLFKFTPAISFYVNCKTQEEVDELWEKLSEGGKKQMRLAPGQVRRVVAGRPDGSGRAAERPRSCEGAEGHEGDDADGQARHRGSRASG